MPLWRYSPLRLRQRALRRREVNRRGDEGSGAPRHRAPALQAVARRAQARARPQAQLGSARARRAPAARFVDSSRSRCLMRAAASPPAPPARQRRHAFGPMGVCPTIAFSGGPKLPSCTAIAPHNSRFANNKKKRPAESKQRPPRRPQPITTGSETMDLTVPMN